ncbi:MAG TPA: DUF4304 domain-containing protein [Capsulimonadaceae bacterium]|jgi:hypothetical protein
MSPNTPVPNKMSIADAKKQARNQYRRLLTAVRKDVLADYGFVQKGVLFVAPHETVKWVVGFQASQWPGPTAVDFTINCGVYINGVAKAYSDRPEPDYPDPADCSIETRIAGLSPSRFDKWWILDGNDSSLLAVVCDDVTRHLRDFALPFFESIASIDDAYNFLLGAPIQGIRPFASPIRREEAIASIEWTLGDRDAACARLLSAIEQNAKSPGLDTTRHVLARIVAINPNAEGEHAPNGSQ